MRHRGAETPGSPYIGLGTEDIQMSIFQVRLFPEGEYQKVVAATALEAAERLYGRELSEVGRKDQLRVMVHEMIFGESAASHSLIIRRTSTGLKSC
jgi:hypothetical protein